MRSIGRLAVVAMILALPAPALAADEEVTNAHGGLVGWLLGAFSDQQSAGQAVDSEPSSPPLKTDGTAAAESKPIDMSAADDADKDSYKPDAGDPQP